MDRQLIVNNLIVSFSEKKGSGDGRETLLFLHGWRSNKEVWSHVINRLDGVGFDIFAINLPGFGASQAPTDVFDVSNYAEIVASFIKKLGLSNVVIIGHSFGGRIAIKLASTHPQLINKIVLVDSAGFVTAQITKKIVSLGAKIIKPFFKPEFMQPLRKKIYRTIGAEDYVATPNLQKTFVQITSEDLSADMGKIICPTLIIFGQNDKDTSVGFGKKMNSLIPNSKLLIISNAGHFSFLDDTEEFVKILTEFIK
jgi:pimeloyl-ACP methyl ester carboxylesterase